MSEPDADIAALVLRERTKLRRFIRGRVPNPADADDVLQDVLFEFVEAYHLPAPIEHVSAWLFRVARNRIIDLFRRRKERSLEAMPETSDENLELALWLPAADDPAAAYARSVLLGELQAAIDELPAEQREVFMAHELDGISFAVLAARLGVPINTLLARKRYAVLKLRDRLQSTLGELNE